MGGRSSIRRPGRRSRFNRNSQFAKFGSTRTFTPLNCARNDACPIHVNASSSSFNGGNSGVFVEPVRFVSQAFHTISWKNVRGLKWFDGVSSLNERGIRRRRPGVGLGSGDFMQPGKAWG